jgi:gamma-glutamylcyclotransferase (GGCT)/AIG2-like uncharacterized protein YtfP
MTLHFAYGSNMSRRQMAARCPTAVPLGTAELSGWRYVIMLDGYASIVPTAGGVVHGAVWRLTPRDLAALNAYESLDSGLYRRRTLTVRRDSRSAQALVYVGRDGGPGRPQSGYHAAVVEAARTWGFPDRYVAELGRWLPAAHAGALAENAG